MPSPPGSNGCFRRQYSCLPSLLGAVIVFKPENIGLLALEALPSLLALETLFAPDGRPAVPPEICDLVLRLGIDIACHVATLRSTLATRDAAEQAESPGLQPSSLRERVSASGDGGDRRGGDWLAAAGGGHPGATVGQRRRGEPVSLHHKPTRGWCSHR